MLEILLPLAMVQSVPASGPAVDPPLDLEQQAAVRCSAAFAVVGHGQQSGNAEALAYPLVNERGREFFVRTAARLMDERGLTRDQVAMLMREEAQTLWDDDAVEAVMPGCLLLLDASGL